MLAAFLKCKCFSSWDASILGGLTELPPSSRGAGPPKCCSLEPSWAAFWKESSGSRWYSYLFHSCKECRANPALPRAPEDSFNFWLPSRSSLDLPDEVKLSLQLLLSGNNVFLQERAGPRLFSKRHQDQYPLPQPDVESQAHNPRTQVLKAGGL